MPKLIFDLLYDIINEFHNDRKTLLSCLLVNKFWCEITIPILWRNPWNNLTVSNEKFLLNLLIKHLSVESRNNLKNQGIRFSLNSYKKPLFNYISFCKHLDLCRIHGLVIRSEMFIIYDEILRLFINENNKFTHLYIPLDFNCPIHLFPGFKCCLSDIEFLSCSTSLDKSILSGLIGMCKYIRKLELRISKKDNNHRFIRLIELNRPFNVSLSTSYKSGMHDEEFNEALELSLIKYARRIQSFSLTKSPNTADFLSHLFNLTSLRLNGDYGEEWNCLKHLSLPFLQTLKIGGFIQAKFLANIITSTKGYLNKINIDIDHHSDINNQRIIQAIYRNCPNLKRLKLEIKNNNISELEPLLRSCKYLNKLHILKRNNAITNWNNYFKVLSKSSPTNLSKFKFDCRDIDEFQLDSLELFFDNWKVRQPMILQFNSYINLNIQYKDFMHLIDKYKKKGNIKYFVIKSAI
ncbi:hypothetical protein RhiirA4_450699 [Rhizophagus irregularis]|uniref:F-box domain-containing protein n=1 Tax=Rhizophagus irregularis TaxID=588596 RepID=A0A2I1FTT2_9GLOM|nr:hypothetical protein RhiirA4_450699 [Rhizophagus irregularis]